MIRRLVCAAVIAALAWTSAVGFAAAAPAPVWHQRGIDMAHLPGQQRRGDLARRPGVRREHPAHDIGAQRVEADAPAGPRVAVHHAGRPAQ